jgi:hypothetical protein
MPRGVYDRTKKKGPTVSDITEPDIPNPDDPTPQVDPLADPPVDPTPVAELCGLCWPDGWPHNTDSAMCEHGEWTNTTGN